jgi:hypothetical protein
MAAKQHFFLNLLLLIAVQTFSQITKGSKTIGYVNLGISTSAYTYQNAANPSYESNNYSVGLSFSGPFYMITNRLQMGLGLGFDLNKTANYRDFSSDLYSYYTNSFKLIPSITYFFTKNSKGFYANIGGEFNPVFTRIVNPKTTNQEGSESVNLYKAQLGLGYVKPINDNILLNYQLGYEKSSNFDVLSFIIYLNNFVPSIFAKKTDEPLTFIKPERSIVNGVFFTNYYASPTSNISVYGSFEKLKFKNNNLAFGYYGTAYFQKSVANYYSFRGGSKARYYIPMTKKWFIYPELGLGFDVSFGGIEKNSNIKLDFVRTVGFNYFITPFVALDANVNLNFNARNTEKFQPQQLNSTTSFNSSISLGVTYFIDKLF